MDSALAHALARAGYREGSTRLSPGEQASVRFDQYCALGDPELMDRVCQAMEPLLPEGAQGLAGRELGGVVLATALANRVGLPAVFVRRGPVAHGTGPVEGPDVTDLRVVVVEDVVHALDDVAPTVAAVRDVGAEVDTVVCLLDLRTDVDPSVDWNEVLRVHLVPLFVGDEVPTPGVAAPGSSAEVAGPAAAADSDSSGGPSDKVDNVVDISTGRRRGGADE